MTPLQTLHLVCLGIESTAHTFGASLVDSNGEILTNQNSTYKPPLGSGIHPRKAALHHVEVAEQVVRLALRVNERDGHHAPDCIAYSAGPGLGPCLRIGATIARALSCYFSKPLVPVHHGVAHLDLAMSVTGARDPLAVLVSGGHTGMVVHTRNGWVLYGETEDITLGNLLDMFAREVGLPSPGGPSVETLARRSRKLLRLPYTVKGNDVAFSGLLTAAIRSVQKGTPLPDVCYSLQEVGFSMLAEAVERSLVQTRKKEVLLAGGVAANRRLREMVGIVAKQHEASFHPVPSEYSGDCGAQIACSGIRRFLAGRTVSLSESHVVPRWRLDEAEVPWVFNA